MFGARGHKRIHVHVGEFICTGGKIKRGAPSKLFRESVLLENTRVLMQGLALACC